MQKTIITYLVISILFQGMFNKASLLFTVGELFEDYQIHNVKYEDSVVVFLSKHFGSLEEAHQQQHQEEQKEHQHPVKDYDSNSHTDYVAQGIELEIVNCMVKSTKNNTFYYQNMFSAFEKQKIFQPPQV